ncbi:AI-2E family transporter [Shimia abyssi]|uniref:Putative PurR-regulated permease PerM n=1 Tax=Shimia abyssi TaxID=1662395 RepID=A0A2P8F9G1_9RHOB|nr:AI-2E family transporter [Shimia abyssi]PSL18360.1 putative PurR-regulated permease PerM [Shimia abyssi]
MNEFDERRVIDLGIRLLFLALFLYAALLIVAPLAGIVLWAVILAVAIYPLFDWLAQKLGGRRGWASTIIVLIGLAVTIGPIAASVATLAEYGAGLTDRLSSGDLKLPPPPERINEWEVLGPKIQEVWSLFDNNLATAIDQYGEVILHFGTTVLGKLAGVGVGLLAMALSIIVMGMMLSPGPKLGEMLQNFGNRVFAPKGGEFVDLAAATVRNVSRGVLGVAAIQAFLAGVVMLVFGIDAAGPLAILCLILGIIQVGPAPVIIPVIIWAWSAMTPGIALVFTIIMVPVMIMDNFLRPIFIARGLETPILVILVGVIGGVLSGGIVGIFIGPVILSVFYELVMAWMNADAPSEEDAESEEAPS